MSQASSVEVGSERCCRRTKARGKAKACFVGVGRKSIKTVVVGSGILPFGFADPFRSHERGGGGRPPACDGDGPRRAYAYVQRTGGCLLR